jgi:hypothetical protein
MGKARALVSKLKITFPKRNPDVGLPKPHTKHKHQKTKRFINDCTEKRKLITLSFFTFSITQLHNPKNSGNRPDLENHKGSTFLSSLASLHHFFLTLPFTSFYRYFTARREA